MGGERRYYFAPPADPLNPLHHARPRRSGSTRSAAPTRARFDERGFAYFIREVYDSFYPGYGESWPIFQGVDRHDLRAGVGARPASQARRRHDADVSRRRHAPLQRRDHDRVHGGEESRAAAARLLRVPPQRDERRREGRDRASTCWSPGAIRRWPARLARQPRRRRASRCAAPTSRSRSARARCPAGAYLVSTAQPSGRLVRNLLDIDDPAARGVHQGAGPPPQEAARRSDLRHHRVEPAARCSTSRS